VVDDNIVRLPLVFRGDRQRILRSRRLHCACADAHSQEADNDVVGFNPDPCVAEQNTSARSALSGDSDERFSDAKVALELDRPTDAEHHRPRPLLRAGIPKAARAGVVEIGDE